MTETIKAARLDLAQDFSLSAETGDDRDWIDQLHADAFGPGRFTRAAFCVREQAKVDRQLCLVAKIGDAPAGTVRLSHVHVGAFDGYLLGPLAIFRQFRNCGIGGALLARVNDLVGDIDAAQFILLVGDEPYYRPHGYEQVARDSILFPAPVDPSRILIHRFGAVKAGDIAGVVKA